MKKFLNLLLIFTAFLVLNQNVAARTREYSCSYKGTNFSYTLKLTVQNYSSTTSKETIYFNTGNNNNKEKVRNWETSYFSDSSINFSGKSYYRTAALKGDSNLCPKYLLLSNSNTGYNLFVSDEDNKENIVKAIKNTFSTLKNDDPYEATLVGTPVKTYDEIDEPESCLAFDTKALCTTNNYFSCMWIGTDTNGYCNVNDLQYVKCGGAYDIPAKAPQVISLIINFLKITAPALLVLVSIITLVKAVAASKEDEMKKAQNILIKRLIAAVILFLVIQITQFVILKVADDADRDGITSCLSCFVNNECGKNTYYKTNVYGTDICTYLDGTDLECGE